MIRRLLIAIACAWKHKPRMNVRPVGRQMWICARCNEGRRGPP